jgi:hypothetical protein
VLNEHTVKDSYPLPRIDRTLEALSGSKWFCTMDLASGFWQISLKEEDRKKTAFATTSGLYEFRVMPFGLCNAPATFERCMENVLRGLCWKECLVYIDDIIVAGISIDDTNQKISLVMDRLREAKLKLKPQKCALFRTHIEFLGHTVSASGIQPSADKVKTIFARPRPRTREEMKTFLGMTGYYKLYCHPS